MSSKHNHEFSAEVIAEADAFLRKTFEQLEKPRLQIPTTEQKKMINDRSILPHRQHRSRRRNRQDGTCPARATVHVIEMLEDRKHRYTMRRFAKKYADLANKTLDMNHIDHINRSRMTSSQLYNCLKSFRTGWNRRERHHDLLMSVLNGRHSTRLDLPK